jgi:hypothetical protein
LKRVTRLAVVVFFASCASGQKVTGHTEAIESYVYALPLDVVLSEAKVLLVQKGWHVERSADQLGTNWRIDAGGTALGYRVEGERIDEDHCGIRIEALAATSFAPPPSSGAGDPSRNASSTPMYARDSSGGNGASGGRSTGWDGVDAPTTLGEPPPGMVTLPRGRDEALEWVLLQRLDPHAAEAIARADGRSHAPAALVVLDAGTPLPHGAAASTPGCGPEQPTGLEGALADRRLVILADVPGTKEIPDFVGRLACQAARQSIPTVVALALLRIDQDWVDTYFASQGSTADRAAFLQVTRSFARQPPAARGSEAVLQLLDRLRTLRDAGVTVRVVAFDEAGNGPGRERARASTLEHARRIEPEALLLVVAERSEARTVLATGDIAAPPVGWYLAHWGLKPLALDLRSPGGRAWSCTTSGRGECGPVAVPATSAPASAQVVELYANPDAQGFRGNYSVGLLTVSPPPN